MTIGAESDRERHLLHDLDRELPGSGRPGTVRIEISRPAAQMREAQLLLWMLTNLTSRMSKVVTRLFLSIPNGIPTHEFVVPFSPSGRSVSESVLEGAKTCARECDVKADGDSAHDKTDVLVLVGNGETKNEAERIMRVSCDGWLAYVGVESHESSLNARNSNNPFGAFTTACIAAGDIFKFIRGMKPEAGTYAEDLYFSSYDCSEIDVNRAANPNLVEVNLGRTHLVGCGAVGNAFCHALYSTGNLSGDIVLIDREVNEKGENETIEKTNLDRYLMLTVKNDGEPKASALKERLESKKSLSTCAHNQGFAKHASESGGRFERVLSCVDTSESRHAIQDQLPRIIHGASTHLMSAQVSLYDLGKGTPCLKCYNQIRADYESDSSIINRLRALDAGQREEEARKREVDPARLTRFLNDPACAELDEFSIQKFASPSGQRDWAVSFVSAMSGFMLAAEVYKHHCSTQGVALRPLLDGVESSDLYFNFWWNRCSVHPTKPREGCWCQGNAVQPRAVYRQIWDGSYS